MLVINLLKAAFTEATVCPAQPKVNNRNQNQHQNFSIRFGRYSAFAITRFVPKYQTYFKHRVTHAMSESINSKIQTIKQMACGFRNIDHFKTAIYFHCGGSIYTHAKPGSPPF